VNSSRSRQDPITKENGSALKILIFGINYAPELAGIAPYTTGLAEHFANQGHHVEVVTGIPHYPEWRPQSVSGSSRGSNPTVHRYWHHVPRRATAGGRALYELSWLVSAGRALRRPKADVVIGVIPSLSGGVLAAMAAWRLGVPFGLIFQDTMGAAAKQSGYAGAVRYASIARRIETFIGRRARRVAIVADGFRGYLEGLGIEPTRIHRVRNWTRWIPSSETRGETRARLGWHDRDFICLHAGNMGKKQGLDNLLDATVYLGSEPIRIVLAGGGNDRDRLVQKAQQLDLGNVAFLDVQSAGAYEAMLGAADLLIVNQRASVGDMALPSKLTSYFAAGRPLIAAVSPTSETAAEVRSSQGGIVVAPENPYDLAKTVVKLREDSALAGLLANNGRNYAAFYLHQDVVMRQFDELLAALSGREPSRQGLATATK
jgi:colanic acid biosynthesis glycosyl transferase WcaI